MESKSNLSYSVSIRDVKHPRLEFKTGNLVLILPKGYDQKKELLSRHRKWIQHKYDFISSTIDSICDKKLNESRKKEQLQQIVHRNADYFCNQLGTTINKIYFRKMRTKWGSCSHGNNLTLNTLMTCLPENLIEYVVFHEIAHTVERKHNERFWNIIRGKYPNYAKLEKDLFSYWFLIHCVKENYDSF